MVETHNNPGLLLLGQARAAAAIRHYQSANQINQGFAEVYNNLGLYFQRQGRYQEASKNYQKAIELKPDFAGAHLNRAMVQLLVGNFVEGWPEFEWRWKCLETSGQQRLIKTPPWQGEDLHGRTILLRAEQGLGDTLQFVRYAPLVAARGGRIILECQPTLVRLLQDADGIEQVVVPRAPLPEHDVHCPLLGLPRIFQTTLASIPAQVPYLCPQDSAAFQLPQDATGKLKVGVVWAGNPQHKNDRQRSLALKCLQPLLAVPGIAFYALQTGEAAGQISCLNEAPSMVDLSASLRDFSDTAAIVNQLDLVISVDTAVVHLAGALGKRVWVLLPFSPDWRWLLDRVDSPWYPTLRLFRQSSPGDWEGVIIQVTQALEAWRDGLIDKAQTTHRERQRALFYRSCGLLNEAVRCFERIVQREPNQADNHYNLGLAHQENGQFQLAVESYQAAHRINPQQAPIYINMGAAYKELGQFDKAIECQQQALHLQPGNPEAYNNLGSAWQAAAQLDEAIGCYRAALKANLNYFEAQLNLAIALREAGQFEEALQWHYQALQLQPNQAEAHASLSFTLLLLGRFREGWQEYEWRRQTRSLRSVRRNFTQPLWRGEPLAGKSILLHGEQGLGDIIQFVRYAPLVAERGGRVIIEARPVLQHLLKTVPGVSKVINRGEPLPVIQVQAPLLSLPGIFGTSLETIPASVPYVNPSQSLALDGAIGAASALKVGLVWAGNPRHQNDRQRSMPFARLLPLLALEGIAYHSLQVEYRETDRAALSKANNLVDLSRHLYSFSDCAAAMTHLDLVISVDTAMAHLAGALGKRVWTLLPHAPDWRWLLGRADSPWYPTMRLFRQSVPGDWDEVICRVAEALRRL